MSVLCETLVALNLTLGVFCQPVDNAKAVALPDDDKNAWAVSPPPPAPKPKMPDFPPVVIQQAAPPPMPVPPPPPPPAPMVKKEPEKPNPYRVVLEAALSQRDSSMETGVEISPVSSGAPKAQLASLSPQSLHAPGLPPMAGPLDLPPPNTQDRYETEGKTSGLPVDNSRILAADRYISGILETGFNSQLDSAAGGEVIIQTSRDVFGYHGRNVLIPKGSRMICAYSSPGKQGQTRIGFTCKRILIAGHRAEIRQLNSVVGDAQGRGGTTGEVDDQFEKKYGTAFMLAGISTGVRIATAAAASNNQNSPLGNIADKGSEELSQKLGEISASVVEQMVNLESIVTISQGTRVQIRPSQDWYIQKIGEAQ